MLASWKVSRFRHGRISKKKKKSPKLSRLDCLLGSLAFLTEIVDMDLRDSF
jgi:hypothetical protein